VQVLIPCGCLLDPSDTAAVVGGNVLTSQRVVDVVLRAFDVCSASQVICNTAFVLCTRLLIFSVKMHIYRSQFLLPANTVFLVEFVCLFVCSVCTLPL